MDGGCQQVSVGPSPAGTRTLQDGAPRLPGRPATPRGPTPLLTHPALSTPIRPCCLRHHVFEERTAQLWILFEVSFGQNNQSRVPTIHLTILQALSLYFTIIVLMCRSWCIPSPGVCPVQPAPRPSPLADTMAQGRTL
jgi:hypothetical protein